MRMRKSWRSSRAILALSVLTICVSGCGLTGTAVAPIDLPAAPEFMAPIAKPVVKVGDDARLAFKKMDKALDEANSRLTNSRGWYGNVRKGYAGAKL